MNKLFAAVAVLLLVGAVGAARAEQIDNPEYKHWSQFKAGTWATLKSVTEAAGNKTAMEQTHKLVEVTGEKCVIETSMKMEVAGQTIQQPAMKRDVPAKIEKGQPVKTEGKDAPKPKEGEETISVAGKSLKCKTVEVEFDVQGQKGTSKSWTSDEVPGMVVKSSTNSAAAKVELELVNFEKK